MPFIPHTPDDVQEMLAEIGEENIEKLFDEIPQNLRYEMKNYPDGLCEMEMARVMKRRARKDSGQSCFIGAGAYEHHIPAAVWDIAARGEFMTAYTPYQAEASQGTLQLIYEFQTMMASLTGMDVSNASMYEGASALAEAILMAVRANRKCKNKKVIMPETVHPSYRRAVDTIIGNQGIEIISLPYDRTTGCADHDALKQYDAFEIAALVIPQPNFFGMLEDVDALSDWAHKHGAMAIAVVNPMTLALLKEPSQWGETGADIVCGEGQPLGVPLASGGPYFGFLTCKQEFVRQMPGRIVGMTEDLDGKPGFGLTLQAREQHIRRSKATSNICTNQGLAVTASTIFMSLVGVEGLRNVARQSHANTLLLKQEMEKVSGVEMVFQGPCFHEFVMRLNKPIKQVLSSLADRDIQGGYTLTRRYPELGEAMLVCVTETKTENDIDAYVLALKEILE